MNTLRNLAALALLALAAIAPAHAQQADAAKEALRALAQQPEIAALASDSNGQAAIAGALQQQLTEQDRDKLKALATDENKAAAVAAVNDYLAKHPLKDGQDLSDRSGNAKHKAIAEALKARLRQGR